MHRDRHIALLVGGLCTVALVLGASATSPARSASPNPIQQENALHGDDGWLHAGADNRAIEGYTTEVSVQPGDTVHFHVSTTPDAGYHIDVYRLGWYGGIGARLVACLPACSNDESGTSRDVPAPDVNGEVDAGWPVTDQLTVPSTWVSGYYLVDYVLTSGPQAGRAAIGYVIVRDPPSRQSAILVQVPVDTWQAYNAWGGKSLYNDQSTGGRRATHVSFERPYRWEPQPGGLPLEWEYPLVRFLERSGYDVSYQTDVDTDANPGSLLQHRLVITAGHGEYWSKATRDAFDNARDKGTNLAFMGANTGYWQIRYAGRRAHHRRVQVAVRPGARPCSEDDDVPRPGSAPLRVRAARHPVPGHRSQLAPVGLRRAARRDRRPVVREHRLQRRGRREGHRQRRDRHDPGQPDAGQLLRSQADGPLPPRDGKRPDRQRRRRPLHGGFRRARVRVRLAHVRLGPRRLSSQSRRDARSGRPAPAALHAERIRRPEPTGAAASAAARQPDGVEGSAHGGAGRPAVHRVDDGQEQRRARGRQRQLLRTARREDAARFSPFELAHREGELHLEPSRWVARQACSTDRSARPSWGRG